MVTLDLHPEARSAVEIAEGFNTLRLQCERHDDYRISSVDGHFTSTGYGSTYSYASEGIRSALAAVFGKSTADLLYDVYILRSGMSVPEAITAWERDRG